MAKALYIVSNDKLGGSLTEVTFSNADDLAIVEAASYEAAALLIAEDYEADYGWGEWDGLTIQVAKVPTVKTFDAEVEGITITERKAKK